MKKRSLIFIVLFFFMIGFPSIAEACPMCQGGTTKNTLAAYRGITLLLALLPVAGGIGIFYWLNLKSKRYKESQQNISSKSSAQ